MIGTSFVLMFGFGRIVDVVNKYTVDLLGFVIFLWGVSMCSSRKLNDWEPDLGFAEVSF